MTGRLDRSAVNPVIAPGDTMYEGNTDYYFKVGESALSVIDACLSAAGIAEVDNILDYGCGYGRVLRWMLARFPDARIVGADIDENALSAVASLLGVRTELIGSYGPLKSAETFDLIWVGSVFTHLRESWTSRLLSSLLQSLCDSGLLVFTTHGPHVARRIENGENLYGLESTGAERLRRTYRETGYGFGPYMEQTNYGISVVTAAKMMTLVEELDFKPIYYRERGWIQHQDAYGVCAK